MLLFLGYSLAVFILWSLAYYSAKNSITPTPSSKRAQLDMLEIAPVDNCVYFDLGSGFGSFCRRLAKQRPHTRILGLENSIFPLIVSRIIQRVWRYPNLRFYRVDFLNVNLRELASIPETSYETFHKGQRQKNVRCIYFTYLSVSGMQKLKKPLKKQLKKEDLLISNYFQMHGWKPLTRESSQGIYVYDASSYFEAFLESQSMMSLDSYRADPSTIKQGT